MKEARDNWLFLNYELNENTPSYGNRDRIERRQLRSLCCGDSSNNTHLSLHVHTGTHIDFPCHFCEEGKSFENYPAGFWCEIPTQIVEINLEESELLTINHLEKFKPILKSDIIFLIIKTGFGKFRNENFETSKYIFDGPGVHPECAGWIRENSNVQIIGFDFISLTSFKNREIGKEAHQKFLCLDREILIVEDMKLNEVCEGKYLVNLSPLSLSKADGAPTTIFAKKISCNN